MRSLLQAFAIVMTAVAAALGEAFGPLKENPRRVWGYGVMAVIAGVTGAGFWWPYRGVDGMEDRGNVLPPGAGDVDVEGRVGRVNVAARLSGGGGVWVGASVA
jgi:hypothetical protein